MQRLTLGKALAYIETEMMAKIPQNAPPLAPSDNLLLQNLKNRLQNIEHSHSVLHIVSDVPKHQCSWATPYLADNSDFFLAHLIVRNANCWHGLNLEQQFKHLNKCFNCFEIYCQVLQDYYHTCQEIITTNRVRGFQS